LPLLGKEANQIIIIYTYERAAGRPENYVAAPVEPNQHEINGALAGAWHRPDAIDVSRNCKPHASAFWGDLQHLAETFPSKFRLKVGRMPQIASKRLKMSATELCTLWGC
jgi:hypothetical protein